MSSYNNLMNVYSVLLLKLPQSFPGQWLWKSLHQLIPRDGFRAVVHPDPGDASFNRADEEAEPAPNAVFFPNLRLIDHHRRTVDLLFLWIDVDALVRAVFARNVAQAALNAL